MTHIQMHTQAVPLPPVCTVVQYTDIALYNKAPVSSLLSVQPPAPAVLDAAMEGQQRLNCTLKQLQMKYEAS